MLNFVKSVLAAWFILSAGFVLASPFYISIIELIVTPQKYMGEKVMVIGFNGHNRMVFLTESAAKYRDSANGISFSDHREGFYDFCEDAFVRVTGTVARDPAGGLFLQDVTSVFSLDENRECKASLKFDYKKAGKE